MSPEGKICGEIFTWEQTKCSTTNTLRHLEKEHGLIRPEISFILLFKFLQNTSNKNSLNQISLNETQVINIKKKLVEFIVEDCQPFYVINSKGFQNFVYALNLSFKIPNINSIRKIIFINYNNSQYILKQYLNFIKYVSLTTDF